MRVQPRASRDSIDGTYGEQLKVRIMAPPVDGKAYECLIRYLARVFGVPGNAVEVLSGHTSGPQEIVQQPG